MKKTALQFSGGKDSLACLYLNKDKWDDMYVVWCDTGAAYPETLEYMEYWKSVLPRFIHLKSDQPSCVKECGWPVDVVPVENTVLGKLITGNNGPTMQSYLDCCARNVWFPLHNCMVELGVERVIKGQRNDDCKKSTSRHGEIVCGMEYIMPIQDWTEADVFAYLESVNAYVPSYYRDGEKTGRDCWDCTAYLSDNLNRIHNLPFEKREEVMRRLSIIDAEVSRQKGDCYGVG